jgi:RimJ/RimL family protein N-acetyltransferase
MLIYGQDEYVSKWVSDLIPYAGDFGPCVTIGATIGDRLIAGFVYNDYQPQFGTIQLSMASTSPMWAKPEIIKGVLSYPFEQLGCYKVWLAIAQSNAKMLKITKRIGFKQEAILAHHFGIKNHCIMERMLLPDYQRIFGE